MKLFAFVLQTICLAALSTFLIINNHPVAGAWMVVITAISLVGPKGEDDE